MQKRRGVVHVFFECEDCGKKFEHQKNGQANAAKHAQPYGHKVQGDVCLFLPMMGGPREVDGSLPLLRR